MRGFFLGNGVWIVAVLLVIEVLVLIGLIREYRKSKATIALLMTIVTAGLLYDGCVILIGRWLPEGLLKVLSVGRFLFHGLCMPLLLMIAVYALTNKKVVHTVFWVIAAVLMAAGAVAGLLTKLDIVDFAGFIRCASSSATPAWADSYLSILSVAMVVPLILAGIWLMIKKKGPFLFLSGFVMFAFSALAPATGNTDLIFLISMIGEALMVLFFLLHARRANKKA